MANTIFQEILDKIKPERQKLVSDLHSLLNQQDKLVSVVALGDVFVEVIENILSSKKHSNVETSMLMGIIAASLERAYETISNSQ